MKFFNNKKKSNELLGYSPTSKRGITSCCTISFSCETEKKKEAINTKLKKLIDKYINTPDKLINYLKFNGITVYNSKKANIFLALIVEEEGFITPTKGFSAFIINLLTNLVYEKKLVFSFETKPMFIFQGEDVEIYTIARALYKYFCYKAKLPGTDYKSQKILKKVSMLQKRQADAFGGCSIAQMHSCKEAIARDIDSIKFALDLSNKYSGAKGALNKMKAEHKINI